CTCMRYQENEIPCAHAYAFLLHQQKSPINYFPSALSLQTWRQTYLENWKPISIENLEHHPISPPATCRLPGSPKKKCAQHGDHGIAALQYARRMHGEEVIEDQR
ncbi:hypothetical protein L873DRAFT_1714734, partial [Choiromyces venosus 120613-1]